MGKEDVEDLKGVDRWHRGMVQKRSVHLDY